MIISCLLFYSLPSFFRIIWVTTQQRRTNDVRTLSEPNVMSNATNRWKGPCHLQYDSHDARVRSFITWPRYSKPDHTILGIAGFWYTGKPLYKLSRHMSFLTLIYLRLLFLPQAAVIQLSVLIAGWVWRTGRRQMILGPSTHFGPHFAFTWDT